MVLADEDALGPRLFRWALGVEALAVTHPDSVASASDWTHRLSAHLRSTALFAVGHPVFVGPDLDHRHLADAAHLQQRLALFAERLLALRQDFVELALALGRLGVELHHSAAWPEQSVGELLVAPHAGRSDPARGSQPRGSLCASRSTWQEQRPSRPIIPIAPGSPFGPCGPSGPATALGRSSK